MSKTTAALIPTMPYQTVRDFFDNDERLVHVTLITVEAVKRTTGELRVFNIPGPKPIEFGGDDSARVRYDPSPVGLPAAWGTARERHLLRVWDIKKRCTECVEGDSAKVEKGEAKPSCAGVDDKGKRMPCKKAFRFVNLDEVTRIKIDGEEYNAA